MSEVPDNLKFTKDHEWISVDDKGMARVGITDYAQDSLSDVVFVELPEVGTSIAIDDETGVVESVKAASDVYAPVSGEIIEVNEDLVDEPESINSQPYEAGWLYKVELTNESDVDELLTADEYADLIADD